MNPILLTIIIIASVLIIIYFILAYVIFLLTFKRKKCVNLVDLDLDKTQYKDIKDLVLNSSKEFRRIEYKTLIIKSNDNFNLYARYYDNKSKKTVIMVHGYHATVENNFMIPSKFFYDNGFNLLLIEQRASNSSEGKFITFGDKERYDLALWVSFINKNYHAEEITLYGVSMGASTVINYLGLKVDVHVKNAIIDCAYSNTKEMLKYQLQKRFKKYNPLRFIVSTMMPLLSFYAKLNHFSINTNPITEIMRNKEVRTLYFYGENDTFIPEKMRLECYNADNTFYKRIFHTNALHAMSCYMDFPKVKKEIKDFLKIR